MSNTISVRRWGEKITKELVANAAITPGNLVEEMTTGLVRKHASAGQNAQKMFALEDELQGKEISDNYAAADIVTCGVFRIGDEVLALIADGQNIVIGDKLESAGTGELRKHTAGSAGVVEYPLAIVGIAKEAVDASDSAVTPQASRRITVEIA